MSFLSPERLWLLVVVGLLAVLYVVAQRRRKAYAARLASAHMLDSVIPNRPGWRRHGVTAIFLAALTTFVTAFAQPATERQVPRERATVIVAIDVSLSMEAADVDPTRLLAAQKLPTGSSISCRPR
ncbi:MAG: BatA domain-containing protein [Acidimicrobiales bacterium]